MKWAWDIGIGIVVILVCVGEVCTSEAAIRSIQ